MPSFQVRLKPYDPTVGQCKIDWTAPWGQKFEQNDWQTVEADTEAQLQGLAYLREVTNKPCKPSSGKAFDVCTKEEALDIIRMEKLVAMRRGAPHLPRRGPKPPESLKTDRSYLGEEFEHAMEVPSVAAVAARPALETVRSSVKDESAEEEAAPTVRRTPAPARKAKRKPARKPRGR